jgi:hypothetical protein
MNVYRLWTSLLLFFMSFPMLTYCYSGADVSALLTHLFTTEGYNKKVRPLKDQTTAIEIRVDYFLNCEYLFHKLLYNYNIESLSIYLSVRSHGTVIMLLEGQLVTNLTL